MTAETNEERNVAQGLVARLVDEANMSPRQISEAMDLRVSRRTVYRWLKGESGPQQKSDLDALKKLAGRKLKD